MILASIWLGLWFAERLSRPVGRLASAAQRVGQGDLEVRVAEEQSDDEIAMLGQLFQPDDAPAEGGSATRWWNRTRRPRRGGVCSIRC